MSVLMQPDCRLLRAACLTTVRASTVIQVDQEMLFEIILAANYLDIKPLLSVDGSPVVLIPD